MPVERINKIANDVITAVKRQFGDTSGVQISNAFVFAWINDAQREIIKENPELKLASVSANVTVDDNTYPLLTAAPDLMVVHSIHYRDQILRNLSFVEAQEYIIRTPPLEKSEPVFWYEFNGTVVLWPTPIASYTNGLTIYYSKVPTEVTTTGSSLDLPDIYFNTIVTYCMWKAHEMDDNFPAAQVMQQQFEQSVMKLGNRQRSEDNRYPTIILLPEDNLYG